MRYLLIFFILTLTGCLNVPFIPLVDNHESQIQYQSILASHQGTVQLNQ